MADQDTTGIKRIINAAGYSFCGLKAAFKNEAAFRQEVILVVILIPVGYWLGENTIEKAILIDALLPVLIVVQINSAIESTIDRISKEHHELSGRAKDIASAAVFLSLINVVIVWGLLLTH